MNAVIIDDEKPARDELAFLLKSFPEVSVVAQGRNGIEAIALIKEHNPDVLFLDVQMPGLDGFGVIQKLRERKVKLPHIVFSTAYEHYAVQAFEVNAIDYILKPFDKQRLSRAIQRAKRAVGAEVSPAERLETLVSQLGNRSHQPVKLLVKSQGRLLLVDASEMVCASIEDGTITISTREFDGTSNYRTIEELAESLGSGAILAPAPLAPGEHQPHQGSGAVVQVELHAEDGGQEAVGDSGEPGADEEAAGTAEDVGGVGRREVSFRGVLRRGVSPSRQLPTQRDSSLCSE